MSLTYTPQMNSVSASGAGILITATSSPGTLVHTAPANIDDVDLYLSNSDTVSREAIIEVGGTSNPVAVTIPGRQGKFFVGRYRINNTTIKVWETAGSKLTAWTEVQRAS